MPEMTVCRVSGSGRTWNVGSSRRDARARDRASPGRRRWPRSHLDNWLRKCNRVEHDGAHGITQRVAGGGSCTPMIAPMSPAESSATSSRWLACIRSSRPTCSSLPLVELSTLSPTRNVPEYTRKYVSCMPWPSPRPSAMGRILNASAASGSARLGWRVSRAPVSGWRPTTAGTSPGAGR